MAKNFLVIDVEATCWQHDPAKTAESEVIEIGAVLVSPEAKAIVAEFQSFVQPIRNPILSPFCTELTSIIQEQVASAPAFPQVLGSLRERLFAKQPCIFCSWGGYDQKQLLKDCQFHHVPYPFGKDHLNIKQLFAKRFRCRPCGMAQALALLRMPLRGAHHRGIDDAQNIAAIFMRLLF